jgi:hypothetical protein
MSCRGAAYGRGEDAVRPLQASTQARPDACWHQGVSRAPRPSRGAPLAARPRPLPDCAPAGVQPGGFEPRRSIPAAPCPRREAHLRLEVHGAAIHAQEVVRGAGLLRKNLHGPRGAAGDGQWATRDGGQRAAGAGAAEAAWPRPLPGSWGAGRAAAGVCTCCCVAAKGLGTTTTGQCGDASNAAGGGIAGTRRGWKTERFTPWKVPSTGEGSSPVESLAASDAPRGEASPEDEAVNSSSLPELELPLPGTSGSMMTVMAHGGAGGGWAGLGSSWRAGSGPARTPRLGCAVSA